MSRKLSRTLSKTTPRALRTLVAPLIPALVLAGCGYDMRAWWTDVADAECTCSSPGDIDACVDATLAGLEALPWYEACADEPAPATRRDVRIWRRAYVDTCDPPVDELVVFDDPAWYLGCP